MKHGVKIVAIMAVMTGLSGCAQISKTADSIWGGTKSVAKFVTSPVAKLLRGSPDQDYVFTDNDYDVEIYQAPTSQYVGGGYDVELYTPSALRPAPVQTYVSDDPRDVAFVNLNDDSNTQDWRNCEITSKGYLAIMEKDLMVNPDFEVCMRNKGYVRESEVAHYGTYGGKAVTAPRPVQSYRSGYSYSNP